MFFSSLKRAFPENSPLSLLYRIRSGGKKEGSTSPPNTRFPDEIAPYMEQHTPIRPTRFNLIGYDLRHRLFPFRDVFRAIVAG